MVNRFPNVLRSVGVPAAAGKAQAAPLVSPRAKNISPHHNYITAASV
jgi:hypothetical protein